MSGYQIQRIAVIGAGNMGSGIVQKIATEGFQVAMVDLDDQRVSRGMDIIRTTLDEGVKRKIFHRDQVDEILGRIEGTSDWERLSDVDLVIEAVFEDLEVKRSVFQRLASICRKNTIFATNTSSFYVRDTAVGIPHPERVVGLHYFYHPAKNRLVEVIGHEGSDPDALVACWAFQEAIGKTPIHSADAPGFVVNRFFVPWLTHSVRLVEEGVADIPTVEAAARKAYHIGMGPFELMNVTGIPIALHASTTLGNELGDFYKPPTLLAEKVEEGTLWDLSGEADSSRFNAVSARLLGAVFQVAANLVEEEVATIEEIDIGARVGLRWSKGPFQLINEVGPVEAATMARAATEPDGLTPSAYLNSLPPAGVPISLVSQDCRGALSGVFIQRPDAMNALNPEVVGQFEKAVDDALKRDNEGVVIGGTGKAFVAGADIKFFVEKLHEENFSAIYEFTADGQVLFNRLSGGKKPVVARVHGLSLGGGSELALACDWIVATQKGSFGFPETGIGIYPGLGGTQRLTRRVGIPLAKYLVFTGEVVNGETAQKMGLVDRLVSFADLDRVCSEMAALGVPDPREIPQEPVEAAFEDIWQFFSRYRVDQILSGEADTGGNPVLQKAVKRIGYKSPAALKVAESLIEEGAEVPLMVGLGMELERLEGAFSHPDALEGLSSLIERRRPSWKS